MRGIAMAIIFAGWAIQFGMLKPTYTVKEIENTNNLGALWLLVTLVLIAGGR